MTMKVKTKEQGVVLVITLIMLSVVTLMAIVFLGVSRRERATVTVTTDHITAKLAAEADLELFTQLSQDLKSVSDERDALTVKLSLLMEEKAALEQPDYCSARLHSAHVQTPLQSRAIRSRTKAEPPNHVRVGRISLGLPQCTPPDCRRNLCFLALPWRSTPAARR